MNDVSRGIYLFVDMRRVSIVTGRGDPKSSLTGIWRGLRRAREWCVGGVVGALVLILLLIFALDVLAHMHIDSIWGNIGAARAS